MFDEIIFMKHLSKNTLITCTPPPDLISNSMILTVVNTWRVLGMKVLTKRHEIDNTFERILLWI